MYKMNKAIMNTKYFTYGAKEINYLSSKDKQFADVIKEIGIIKRAVNPTIYESIVQSIVGQQISTTVQHNIMRRLRENYESFDALTFINADEEELRSFGLSYRKISYIKDFSAKVTHGEINLETLEQLSDEEVIHLLTTVKGIGRWTAEMTLLFALERQNIFSFGDLAIKRGLKIIYGYEEITKEIFAKYRKLFSPYCSVASLYLWEVSSRKDN